VLNEALRLERFRLHGHQLHVAADDLLRSAGAAVKDDDFIAAMQQVIPPIAPPDPIAPLETAEGICAQDGDE
jgi:hypothetical protein